MSTSNVRAGGAQATPDPSQVKYPPNNLPPLNPNFTGRVDELRLIQQRLAGHARVGITQQMSPHSQGGMGKTALAVAYAWKSLTAYPGGVFFVNAGGAPWLTKIAALADSLAIDQTLNEKQTAAAVRDRLAQGPPVLVILDGVNDLADWAPDQVAAFFPPSTCRCILTTNRSALDGVEMCVIEGLPRDHGVRLLATFRADAAEPDNRPIVGEIVELLDGLPMGLTLVGSHMLLNSNTDWASCRASIKRLIKTSTASDKRLKGKRQNVPDYVQVVHELFDSVLDSFTTQQRLAMEFAALLPDGQIVLKWLYELLQSKDAVTASKLLGGPQHTGQELATFLLSLQLLRATAPRGGILGMPQLLRSRLQQHFRNDNFQITNTLDLLSALAKRRVAVLMEALPNRAMRAQLSSLVEVVKEFKTYGRVTDGSRLAKDLALILHRLGRHQETVALLDTYLEKQVANQLDPAHVAVLLSNKAATLAALGDADEACRLMNRAIQLDHKHLPPNHPTLASHYSNLAGILRSQGELQKAKEFIRRAIEIEQKRFGEDHPPLGLRHWWLGEIDLAEGRQDSALTELRQALNIMSKHLPPTHKQIQKLTKTIERLEQQAATPAGA